MLPLLTRRRTLTLAAVLAAGAVALWIVRTGEREVDFNADIRPILNENCVTCHGGVRRQAALSLLFRDDALQPAESGKYAIVPGRAGESELIRRVSHSDPDERMPAEAPPLSRREIDLLKRWIDDGAEWEVHWAYVAPETPELPAVSDPAWPENDIDRFVLARLDRENLRPSPQADCRALLRRASLDLTGLPPAPEETDAFCADPSDERYEAAVDRLLASPRFGERWAGYWLDLARYADSNGYEKDLPRTIWKYRDWVIEAFNEDMPFDQFSTEQLAGDLLPDPDARRLIATAFHRNTMTNTEGGTDDEEFRIAAVMDRLNTTFEVWQGTTIACVQCHGHPYDPFRGEEFYELLAFFNNTADMDREDNEPKLYEFDERSGEGQRLVAALEDLEREMHEAAPPDEFAAWTRRFEEYARDTDRPPFFEGRALFPPIIRIAQKEVDRRSPNDIFQLRSLFIDMNEAFEAQRDERSRLRQAIADLEPVTTPILQELPAASARATHIFERGNWLAHGDEVRPDVPDALPPLSEDAPKNRLGLAKWLFDPGNPLTARVAANRFWEQLFGAGLVETVEDFGTQGEPPTHPELLDALALKFSQEFGWSVKRLLREIATSAAYRQSSHVSPELLAVDPENKLLARGPRFRLSAEQIRDQALAVSGLLSDKMLGPSVFPPQPPGLWSNPYSDLAWVTSEGEDRYRRALYTYWRRTVPYPSMIAFDVMTRELCSSRRIRTNSPLQSLVTLNDPVYVEAAVALARRMMEAGRDSPEAQLREGYRLALQRDPPEESLARLTSLYETALADYRKSPEDAAALARIRENAFAGYEEGSPADYGGEPAYAIPEPAETGGASPEEGALAVAANAILNIDAFLTKE